MDAARGLDDFDDREARQQLLPENAQLQFGQLIADAAVNANSNPPLEAIAGTGDSRF